MNAPETHSVFPLSRLGLLRLTGPDVLDFLQGQVTLDVTKLDASLTPAGYCNPKGRLLSVFYLTKSDSDILIVTPRDTIDSLCRRLTLYTLRRHVRIAVDESFGVFGVIGTAHFNAAYPCYTQGAVTLALTPTPKSSDADEDLWWEAAAYEGLPFVFLKTQGVFLPQSINLDLIGGVTFGKGCYVGQEIVSRIHSLGTPSRRAAVYEGSNTPFKAGGDLFDENRNPHAVLIYQAGRYSFVECAVRDTPQTLYLENGHPITLLSCTH